VRSRTSTIENPPKETEFERMKTKPEHNHKNADYSGLQRARSMTQAVVLLFLAAGIAWYYLYLSGLLDFTLIRIPDLNPYGGWNALRSFATDSSHTFNGFGKSTALTVAILIAAMIGGRFFCGWICPLGSLQELFAAIGGKAGVQRANMEKIEKMKLWRLKYIILAAAIGISALGYGAVLAGLSPWKALLILPGIGGVADAEGWLTGGWIPGGWLIGTAVLVGLLAAAFFIERPFCRYLCPLGAAQALVGAFAACQIRCRTECSNCSICLAECPAALSCDDDDRISPECIRCMKCMDKICGRAEQPASCGSGLWVGAGSLKFKPQHYAAVMVLIFFAVWGLLPVFFSSAALQHDLVTGVFRDGTYYGESRGFGGRMKVEVIVADGGIGEVAIIEHHESRGWYEEPFRIIPRQLAGRSESSADTVSGATATSRAIIDGVRDALSQARPEE